MKFLVLNDASNHRQRYLRNIHISGFNVNQADQSVTILLMGGQELQLTPDESRDFLAHIKADIYFEA